MNNAVIALLAFLAGNGVGLGVLYATGGLASAVEVAPPPGPAVARLEAPPNPAPVAPPSTPVVAAPAPVAPVVPTPPPGPIPTPAPAPAPTTPKSPPAVAAVVSTPPHDTEPHAPNGRLVVMGMGEGSLSVSADKVRKGKRVTVPLFKADGLITAHSPDGIFTLDIRYRTDGDGLKASIDCAPMALLTAQGQTATHLSGVAVASAPTRVDVKGGSAGEFSFILSHQK